MSLADEIINGTYKKRDIKVNTNNKEQVAPVKSVADKIIDGTYKTRDITIPTKKYTTPTTGNKFKYIGKSFGTGVHQGTAGIAQGLLTDSANEMQKGRTKDTMTLLNNLVNAYAGNDLNYIGQSALDTINEGINIINDKDKNLWQKAVDLNLDVIGNGAKALMPGMGFYSAVNQLAGKYSDTDKQLLEWNEKLEKPIEEKRQELAKESEQYDGLTNFVAGASQSIGNMVPSIAATAITKNPNVGLAAMGMSVKGQATQEALNKGMDIDKATQIGDAKALIEVATEKLSGGAKIFGKGSLDDIAEDLVKKGAKSKFGRFLLTQVANTGGEILEEEISDVLGNAIDKGTTDPDRKIVDWKQSLETMGSTAFTTTMLNLLTGGMINDYNQISNDMNQYKDSNTGRYLDNNTQNILKDAENIINQNQPIAPINNQQNQTQNEQILPTQQITQQENQMAQNGNMEQTLPAQNDYRNQATNENSNKSSFNLDDNYKQKQNEIIQKSNPMNKDLGEHTWINSAEDIKTYQEAIEEFGGIDNITPDFTAEDVQKAIDTGKVTVYSSYPIEQGTFVTPSKIEAQSYAGNDKVYTKEVSLKDVAWIDELQGQYAKVDNLAKNQEIVYNNFDEESNENESGKNQEASNRISEKRNAGLDETSGQEKQRIQELYRNYKNDIKTARTEIENYIKEDITSRLPISKTKTESFIKSIMNNEEITQKGIYDFLKNNNEYKYKSVDEEVRDIRNYINSTSFNFSESEINELRYTYGNLPRNIKYSNNGVNVDQFYEELSGIYPDYFDKSETINSADRAIDIVEFMKNNKAENIDIQEVLTDDELNDLANKILENKNGYKEVKNILEEEYNKQKKNVILQNKEKTIAPIKNTPGETVNWNEMERPKGKIRKHYKSIIESSNTTAEAKAVARELMGTDTYVPESNKSQIKRADNFIEKYGVEKALDKLITDVDNDTVSYDGVFRRVGVDDIALGERLIQYYSKTGDSVNLQNAIQATAAAGTDAGRAVQALSMLNHQTPTGQVLWIQRSVDKMNNELINKRGENAPQFNFTPEMQQKILEANNQEEMYQAINEVYEELGQQVSKSRMQQIDSWRYFSMLANPKTHIRNIVGNVAMGGLQSVKNKVAGTIESAVSAFNPEMERTHTLKRASKKVRDFAKNDIKNVADSLELNQDKYNPKSRLENSMRTFKSDTMENTLGKLFAMNEKALEVEDAWGLKSGYVKALSEYMTANNLSPDTITDAQLSKARNYAIAEAKEATFHAENSIATAINQFSRKNKFTKGMTDAALPFVKTPMNVAKAGLEYNPTGLIKALTYDTVQLRKGNITVNKYIDNISKGLTGTGIAVLGYALAEAGILKASGGDDDKKEKFDEALGKQAYSIQIGDKTYSLDWLAPAGIPLFVGAEANAIRKAGQDEKSSKSSDDNKKSKQVAQSLENWANAMTNSMSPMAEMSMISGLTSALKSYDQDSTKMLGQMGTNAVKSYVNQFVPTALGQVARTTDKYERSTTSTEKGILPKAIDQTKLQVMSKIPGLRQQLPIKTDVWGKEQEQEGNIVDRAIKNSILPFNIKNVGNTKIDKELNELYGKTGAVSILPETSLDKTYTIDSQKYRMTDKEYSKYKKEYGQTSYNLLNDMFSSNDYKGLTDEQKQKAIEDVYKYAKEKNKIDYAKANNIEVKPSTLYKTMEDLKAKGGNQSSYLNYVSKTSNITKKAEKLKVLSNANYSDKDKRCIYENSLKEADKDTISTYEIMKKAGLDINEWLKYEQQNFSSDKNDDGTVNGKSVSGSKKKKVYSYINNAKMSYDQRLLLLGTQYKLSNAERKRVVNYVNNMKTDYNTRMKIYSKIKGVTVYKNGTIKF